jgi:cytochrome c-type biogenesis protein
MPIASVGAGLLAGILSTLSPCVFPLLPLVIGAATSAHRSGPFWLAGGVAVSFTVAALFIATVGFAVGLDGDVFRTVSAILLVMLGAALLSTTFQARLGFAAGSLTNAADRMIGRLSLPSGKGQFIVGGLLGLVWSPCAGPTLGAASLLAAERKDLGSVAAVVLAFGVGTTLPLVVVALLSRKALLRWRRRMLAAGQVGKVAMGLSALVIGSLILTGCDRSIETALVSSSPEWLTNLTTQF